MNAQKYESPEQAEQERRAATDITQPDVAMGLAKQMKDAATGGDPVPVPDDSKGDEIIPVLYVKAPDGQEFVCNGTINLNDFADCDMEVRRMTRREYSGVPATQEAKTFFNERGN